MTTPRFVCLPYSPWSLKAKWALDHHHVRYRYASHLPLLGEPLLRIRTGRYRGRVTVPVLLTEEGPIEDSADIARWADQAGDNTSLFDGLDDGSMNEWVEASETLLASGRVLTIKRTLDSPRALAEGIPGPPLMWPAFVPVAWIGAHYLRRKYASSEDDRSIESTMRDVLQRLRSGLDGGQYLGRGFSFADIAMACSLACVSPPGRKIDHLGDASRACWTSPELAEEYDDLIAWRDRLIDKHMKGRT